jgi:hypothetical protein
MTIAQPLPAARPEAIASPSGTRQFHRLLTLWADLTAQAAIAAAHQRIGFTELLDRQLRVERELAARHPALWTALESEALNWESSLLHVGHPGSAPSCLYCRRAHQGLPAELTAPRAGTR